MDARDRGMPTREEILDSATGTWQLELFEAPCRDPEGFARGCCCPCVVASVQRRDLLRIIGEPYLCFGGLFSCGPLGQPRDENCVWLEACVCPGCAVAGTRFLVQTRLNKANTRCDDCVSSLKDYVRPVLRSPWCCRCAPDVLDELENALDIVACAVHGCMLAQHDEEIRRAREVGYELPPMGIIAALPPAQQQMIAVVEEGRAKQSEADACVGDGLVEDRVTKGRWVRVPSSEAFGVSDGVALAGGTAPAPQVMGLPSVSGPE